MVDVVVVGAGIAGLSSALRLAKAGRDVLVLEAGDQVGGMIRTERQGGYLLELGPNTIQRSSPEIEWIIEQVGLGSRVVTAGSSSARRYIVRDGRLVEVPSGLGAALRTPLFSAKAKLSFLAEPFRRALSGDDEEDESVASFVRRRMGSEFLDFAIDPFVSGVHAGDPEALSVRHAFPQIKALEEVGGSLIGGAVKTRKNRKARPPAKWKMFSFPGGLTELTAALQHALSDRIKLRSGVTDIERNGDGWRVSTTSETFECRDLVWAAPPHCFPQNGEIVMPSAAQDIVYPPLATVLLGYPASAIGHPLDGFGFLVPSVERNVSILGALFSSTLFEGRAPDGHVLISCFVGGRRRPELIDLEDDELCQLAERDLARLLQAYGPPVFQHVNRWQQAIPQYEIGYGRVKDAIAELEDRHPGIVFCGNYRDGISVPNTIKSGLDAADRLLG